jgi:hypothetical protein
MDKLFYKKIKIVKFRNHGNVSISIHQYEKITKEKYVFVFFKLMHITIINYLFSGYINT